MGLALIALLPGLATFRTVWAKLNVPAAPNPLRLSLADLGALVVLRAYVRQLSSSWR